MTKHWKLIVATVIPILIMLTPSSWMPIEISLIEHRVLAIFVLACLYWVLEPIPVYATSLLVILLELVMISDKSFILFQGDEGDASFGSVLHYSDIMATFSSPIILLFLGGFFLAIATSKYRLDINLARILLKPFGTNPKYIMLGLMIITAVFSMFMSNTATTAMMFAVLTPVLKSFDKGDPGRSAFILAIPFAANVGGIGTPIGTPPNAIGLKYLINDSSISFGVWMAFAVPYVIVLMLFTWLLLVFLFPIKTKEIHIELKGKFLTHWRAMTLYITFGCTVALWLSDAFHGMNSYIVAMIPVVVFSITQVITVEDLKRISWDVLWLVAGGIALGLGLEKSGLSRNLIQSIPFDALSPYMIVLLCTLATFLMANFMSHTATANLLMPIVAALGTSLSSLQPLGGGPMLILAVTFAASLSMALPISTPPNAIAYASGMVNTVEMRKAGIIIGLVGLLGVYLLLFVLKTIGFFQS